MYNYLFTFKLMSPLTNNTRSMKEETLFTCSPPILNTYKYVCLNNIY